MEIVDNAILLIVPGAIDAGTGDILFWGSLSFALAIAGVVAVPVNGWLIARGRGHAVVHETGIHGGPDTRVVGAIWRRRVRVRGGRPRGRGAGLAGHPARLPGQAALREPRRHPLLTQHRKHRLGRMREDPELPPHQPEAEVLGAHDQP